MKVHRDQGVSGAKSRENRPAFDALYKDASRRQFDLIAAWSVDRLGRSLQDLVGFLTEVHALGIDLFLRRMTLFSAHRTVGEPNEVCLGPETKYLNRSGGAALIFRQALDGMGRV